VLKSKYDEAKAVGENVNRSRARIAQLKGQIEQLRVERAMRGEDGEGAGGGAEEDAAKREIEEHKTDYKEQFNRLRALKAEIEQIQAIMEKQRTTLQKDFEAWCVPIVPHERTHAPAPPAVALTRAVARQVQSNGAPAQAARAAAVGRGAGLAGLHAGRLAQAGRAQAGRAVVRRAGRRAARPVARRGRGRGAAAADADWEQGGRRGGRPPPSY